MESLMLKLFDIEAVKFGNFTLKSGILSPVYFDLRVIVSYPEVMRMVSDVMWAAVRNAGCSYDSVCGVPYTALPIATCIAVDHNVPMLIRRKEAKDYGTKKLIEGRVKAGETCLIIEDVVTSGTSVLETVKVLNDVDLVVRDAIVLLDREQGGSQRLTQNGIKLHSVCGISKLLEILVKAEKITPETVEDVQRFIDENNTLKLATVPSLVPNAKTKLKVLSYAERTSLCDHPLTKRLFKIMDEKKTNLAFSADVTSAKRLLQLADEVGPHICVLKTHVDILDDFTPEFPKLLRQSAQKHNFLIFEDRKFADIGNTVKHQFSNGLYHVSQWADLVNAHALPGPGIVDGLKEAVAGSSRATCTGCLLIGEMSSKGNLITGKYTEEVVAMAKSCPDFVVGFICQSRLIDDPTFVHMTPGVKLSGGEDGLGQTYSTPEYVIAEKGSDVIIVGRAILQADNPAECAEQYQQAGYMAFQKVLDNCRANNGS